jgi:hypothetical protein
MVVRMLLARLIWDFDMEIDPSSKDWPGEHALFIQPVGSLYLKAKARSL